MQQACNHTYKSAYKSLWALQQACNPTWHTSALKTQKISYKDSAFQRRNSGTNLTLAMDSYTRLGQELAEEFDLSWQGVHMAVFIIKKCNVVSITLIA